MLRLDAATVLLQWATGGLFFLWFSVRRHEIGTGYGWLLRSIYLVIAVLGVAIGLRYGAVWGREMAGVLVAAGATTALVVSVQRRSAASTDGSPEPEATPSNAPRFPARLDLIAPAAGAVGLIFAGYASAEGGGGGAIALGIARTLVGAAFLGAVTDAMLLGHWYLVQPGLPRRHLHELVRVLGWVWPVEVGLLLLPTGMISVLTGAVDDGWNGVMFWMWATCAVTTIVLVFVTKAALRERYYSAVMAATGLLYLAILTAFGTDLVARAVLDG